MMEWVRVRVSGVLHEDFVHHIPIISRRYTIKNDNINRIGPKSQDERCLAENETKNINTV